MSKGRKREDARRKKCPTRHCAEGRCGHAVYKTFTWAHCKHFIHLTQNGKTPLNCPYYIHN